MTDRPIPAPSNPVPPKSLTPTPGTGAVLTPSPAPAKPSVSVTVKPAAAPTPVSAPTPVPPAPLKSAVVNQPPAATISKPSAASVATIQTPARASLNPTPVAPLATPKPPIAAPAPQLGTMSRTVAAPQAMSSIPGMSRPAGFSTPPPRPLPPPPASPPPTTPQPPLQQAEVRRSPLRFLPFVLGAVVLALIGYFIYTKIATPTSSVVQVPGSTSGTQSGATTGQLVTLTYWGLWEPNEVLTDLFNDFQKTHPNIRVVYQQQTYKDYRERLQTAIASGQGPDIFRFHASWTPMIQNTLSPLPASVMSPTEYQNTFYPAATKQLSVGGQIVGIPLMYDGLALYYNVDALRTANVQPPTTWAELKTLASQLTIRNGDKIQRAGLAIGNASNVEHFSDIIGLLMLQNGADPTNPTTQAALDAMTFYTNFVKVDRVWDATLPSSTVAFGRGDVAMMLAPSWRAHDIKAQNPNLNFKIAPLPQLAGNKVAWASFWAEGVSAQSAHQNEAWQLLQFLSSQDAERRFYAAASKQRSFGELYSRRDLASELVSDPYAAAYLSDAPNAQGWYLSSYTHDNGLNDFMIKYYEDAVNAILGGLEVPTAMKTVQQGTNQTLRQYNVPVSTQQTAR